MSLARTRSVSSVLVLGLVFAGLVPGVAPADATTQAPGDVLDVTLELLAHHDLASPGLDGQVKARGQNGDVAVLGTTAFVGGGALFHGAQNTSGRICTDWGGVKVVDVSDPSNPILQTTIDIEDTTGAQFRGGSFDNVSVSAGAVDTLSIATPAFTGDVLAVAIQRCEPSFFGGARIEFWDVTDPANPVEISEFDPSQVIDPVTNRAGTWGIFEDVELFTRGSQVFAIATTPFSIGNAHDASPFGDFRLIDITDITSPQQVGTFPPVSLGQDSVNGCRTFLAGRAVAPTADGTGAYVSFYDGSNLFGADTAAVFELDLTDLPEVVEGSDPPQFTPSPAHWGYPPDPEEEGNAADVEPFTGPDGQDLVLVSEDDIDSALTYLSFNAPSTVSGEFRGCQSPVGTHLYEYAGQSITDDVVYVGRGCPATSPEPDEYLADPAGKIALLDTGGNNFLGCSIIEKARRAQEAGAVAVLYPGGSGPVNSANNGPEGGLLDIPVVVIPDGASDQMQLAPDTSLFAGAYPFPTDDETDATTGATLCNPSFWDCGWVRSSDNVTVVAWTEAPTAAGHTLVKGQFRSIADVDDRVARGEFDEEHRFPADAGQSYTVGAFAEVSALTAGTFEVEVVWYDASGAVVGTVPVVALGAVTARDRYEIDVTAPAGASEGAVRFGWSGADAVGTAFAYGISVVPQGLNVTLEDRAGSWGEQHIVDFSQSPPATVGTYRSPTSTLWPPPDDGIYSPELAHVLDDEVAFTTWLSDGLRVLDVSDPATPREIASFVPPAVADPSRTAGAGAGLVRGPVWPNRPLVTGVDLIETGPDQGVVVISDINAGLYVLAYSVDRVQGDATSASATIAAGDSLATGTGPATADDPIVTTVTSPTGGQVSIVEGTPSGNAPAGFKLLGVAVEIDAPVATAADPLVLTFRLDGSVVPAGYEPGSVAVFRNGTEVADCVDATTSATPDPCVASRVADGDDIVLTVRTSAASTWTFGVPPTPTDDALRLAGADRVATAISVSRDAFADGTAGAVVLARADKFPDALAGAPLAAALDAPVLLTSSDGLHADTAKEISRVLGASGTVHLLGGPDALSDAVRIQVEQLGYATSRTGGQDRFETAVLIAGRLGHPVTLLVTSGETFADALAAGPAAAAVSGAVLLTPDGSTSVATDAYLTGRTNETLIAVGGPAARAYPAAERIAGADRFGTAVRVAERFFDDPVRVGVARGDDFPDGLTGGAHLARVGAPIVLVVPTSLPDATATYLCGESSSLRTAYVFGGPAAIADTVEAGIVDRLAGRSC